MTRWQLKWFWPPAVFCCLPDGGQLSAVPFGLDLWMSIVFVPAVLSWIARHRPLDRYPAAGADSAEAGNSDGSPHSTVFWPPGSATWTTAVAVVQFHALPGQNGPAWFFG